MIEECVCTSYAAPAVSQEQNGSYGPQLAVLNALITVTAAGVQLPTVLATALECTTDLLELPIGAILLWDPTAGVLRVAASRGPVTSDLVPGGAIPEADLEQWLCGRCFREQRAAFVSDLQADLEHADTRAAQRGMAAIAAVPLTAHEQPLGVLVLSGTNERSFSLDDRAMLQMVAQQVALAIENARLYDDVARRAEQTRVLLDLGQRLSAILDLDALLRAIVIDGREALKQPLLGLWLQEEGRWRLVMGSTRKGLVVPAEAPLEARALLSWVGEHQQPLYLADVHQDSRYQPWPFQPFDIRALLLVPIISGGKVIGALDAESERACAFDELDRTLLQTIANQAGVAISNARLYTASQRHTRQLELAHTRLERAQDQLLQAEKLSAIGQLAAGMAHELNNPLTAIMGFAQLLEMENLSPTGRSDVKRILAAVERAKKIVANLLIFAHQQRIRPQPTDLAALLQGILKLHGGEQAGSREPQRAADSPLGGSACPIVLRQEIEPNLPEALVDPAQIEQLVLHLIRNGYRAMSRCGGTLTVRLQSAGSLLRLEVADEGPGIPADILPHVFDPFFTADDAGEGQGLGLSACFGIVRAHQGKIWAEPRAEGGTRFVVELPLDARMAIEGEAPSDLAGEAVLIVTAEDNVAEALLSATQRMGLRPNRVASGEAALAEVLVHRYDLVLYDGRLPRLDLEQLRSALRASAPKLANHILAIGGTGPGAIGIPIEPEQVQWAIRECLARDT